MTLRPRPAGLGLRGGFHPRPKGRGFQPELLKYMGYDLHITKKKNWFDKEGELVSEKEWENAVSNDPEMKMSKTAEVKTKDGKTTVRYSNHLLAEWKDNDNIFWFDYRNGEICVKDPSKKAIEKMKELAKKMEARVQGDECEIY